MKTAATHNSLDLEFGIKIGLLYPNLSYVLKAKRYLQRCNGNCVSKFSPSDLSNITFEEERDNPH